MRGGYIRDLSVPRQIKGPLNVTYAQQQSSRKVWQGVPLHPKHRVGKTVVMGKELGNDIDPEHVASLVHKQKIW